MSRAEKFGRESEIYLKPSRGRGRIERVITLHTPAWAELNSSTSRDEYDE